jgi:hypothetical protein
LTRRISSAYRRKSVGLAGEARLEDRVEGLFQRGYVGGQPVHQVRLDEREAGVALEVGDVLLGPGDEVVDRDHGRARSSRRSTTCDGTNPAPPATKIRLP